MECTLRLIGCDLVSGAEVGNGGEERGRSDPLQPPYLYLYVSPSNRRFIDIDLC